MKKLTSPDYPYTMEELNAASTAWGCNCGPGSLATMLGLKPDEVRPHIPGFDEKRYTNPTMMRAALKSIRVGFTDAVHLKLCAYGLCRIQWDGPWCRPGVPARVAYRMTHWIGAMIFDDCPGEKQWVFDINAGWQTIDVWEKTTVPELTAMTKGATGKWSATHRWELHI